MTTGNRYPMPFLTDADVFARRAVNAIDAGLLRGLPNPLFDRLFAHAPRKARIASAE